MFVKSDNKEEAEEEEEVEEEEDEEEDEEEEVVSSIVAAADSLTIVSTILFPSLDLITFNSRPFRQEGTLGCLVLREVRILAS